MSQFEETDMCIHVVKTTNDGECLYVCGNYSPFGNFCEHHEKVCHSEKIDATEFKYSTPVNKGFCERTIKILKDLTNKYWIWYRENNENTQDVSFYQDRITYYQSLLDEYQWTLHKKLNKPKKEKRQLEQNDTYSEDNNYDYSYEDNDCDYSYEDNDSYDYGYVDSIYDLI